MAEAGRPVGEKIQYDHNMLSDVVHACGKSLSWLSDRLNVTPKTLNTWGKNGWPVRKFERLKVIINEEMWR